MKSSWMPNLRSSAALALALVFLLRSMNKQFRKITPNPDPPGSPAHDETAHQETPK